MKKRVFAVVLTVIMAMAIAGSVSAKSTTSEGGLVANIIQKMIDEIQGRIQPTNPLMEWGGVGVNPDAMRRIGDDYEEPDEGWFEIFSYEDEDLLLPQAEVGEPTVYSRDYGEDPEIVVWDADDTNGEIIINPKLSEWSTSGPNPGWDARDYKDASKSKGEIQEKDYQ